MTSEGLGRCLKVTLQTHALENFRSCRGGAERRVQRAQTSIFVSGNSKFGDPPFSPHYL